MKVKKQTNNSKTILSELLVKIILVVIAFVTVMTSALIGGKEGIIKLFANEQIVANAEEQKTSTVSMANVLETFNYAYTGDVQTLTIPENGYYKLETWGAQGQNGSGAATYSGYNGGKGGYSEGIIELSSQDQLYVRVGGTDGYNGGGGGATDIRINRDNLYNRVIVAGGGGASANTAGGAAVGEVATGGQFGNGTNSMRTIRTYKSKYNYGEHYGQNHKNKTISGTYYTLEEDTVIYHYSAYGGGGWYGGISNAPTGNTSSIRIGCYHSGYYDATYTTYTTSVTKYGGTGGSGFVYTAQSTVPSGYAVSRNYCFESGQVRAGNQSNPSISGGLETGHAGNGYARITLIEKYDDEHTYYEDKEIVVKEGENHQLDIEKFGTRTAVTMEQLTFTSLNTEIATINNAGLIEGIKDGRTKIEVQDTVNNRTTYIYVDVIKGKVQPKIELGSDYTVSLKADGTVWTWGQMNMDN